MELIQIKGNTYYWDKAICIGVYFINEKNALIIDSGLDDSYAKKILKYFKDNSITLKAIINTHSHADHCGGNSYLQKNTGCEIYASHFEASIINNPKLEPIYLYTASPIKELKNKFLQAKSSKVTHIIDSDNITICGRKIKILNLSGHSPGMIGIETDDKVSFIADSIFDEKTINKHGMLYCMDVEEQLNTLERLKCINSDVIIASHGGLIEDLEQSIDTNIRSYENINNLIIESLNSDKTTEDILLEVCDKLSINLNMGQYYLNKSTISAHLSYLQNEDLIKPHIKENRLLWRKK